MPKLKTAPTIGDRPIVAPAQDRFARANFADLLARQILALPKGDSHVAGLLGSWGSGKTSIINLAAERLAKEGVAVVHFNPWLFSGAEQLTANFFREVATQLTASSDKGWQDISQRLNGYAETVGALRSLPWLGDVVGGLADTLKAGAGAAGKKGRALAGSVYEQRRQIEETLRKANLRILVIIDDLDRLDAAEIREIVRLVRLTGDFPNISYLLAFDRQRVAQAIGPTETEGDAYLEKILQITFDVPQLRQSDLRQFFLEELTRLVDGREDLLPFEQTEWANIFNDVITPLLRSPRDVRRVMNTVPFTLDVAGDEVSPIDLFALETVRVTAPKAFALLPEFAELLTGREERKSKDPSPLEPLLTAAGENRAAIQQMCFRLFPASRTYIDNHIFGHEWQQDWRRERRVANYDVFRFFLEKSLPQDVLAARDVKHAFDSLSNGPALDALLSGMTSEQYEHLLGRLVDYQTAFPANVASECLPVLYKHGNRLREGKRGMFDFGASTSLARVVLRILRRVPEDSRTAVVRTVVERSVLSWRLDLINMVGFRKSVGHSLIAVSDAKSLEDELFASAMAADAKSLASERDLNGIVFWMFRRTQPPDAVAEWLSQRLDEPKFLMSLIRSSLSEASSQGMSDTTAKVEGTLPWSFFESVLGEEGLKRLQTLDPVEEDERTRFALEVARKYLHGWRPSIRFDEDSGNSPAARAMMDIFSGIHAKRLAAYEVLSAEVRRGTDLSQAWATRLGDFATSATHSDDEQAAAFDVLVAARMVDSVESTLIPKWLGAGVGKRLGERVKLYLKTQPTSVRRLFQYVAEFEFAPTTDGKRTPTAGIVEAFGLIVECVEMSPADADGAVIEEALKLGEAFTRNDELRHHLSRLSIALHGEQARDGAEKRRSGKSGT